VFAEPDLDRVVGEYHRALAEFFQGRSEPAFAIYSSRNDVSLASPFGPVARGRTEVSDAAKLNASRYRDGDAIGFECLATCMTTDLAYIVEVERYRAKVGGNEEMRSVSLRVTSIFRREDGTWKLVHRHADPITSVRPSESVVQE
jgi:ketosteroid isomerase-like protein